MFDLSVAIDALLVLFDPSRLGWLLLGVALGLLVGVLPGLGGLVGMSLLLPFLYGMDPYSGAAMLIGLAAVTTTSDTFTAVLFGVPGTSGSQATIMDGYPLARQGQAGRALGAAFFTSMIGGVIGAICLWLFIPFARPLILEIGTPELLMLCLIGVSMVGVLSRGSPLKGLVAGLMGLLLSSVGAAIVDLEYRFTGGILYFYDGISLLVLALGLFAIPEILDLLREGKPIARDGPAGKDRASGRLAGIRDVLAHKWLVVRNAVTGVTIGAIPGVGGSVIDWIAYGVTVQTSKDNERFGKGDIRGVIAPESANNAKEGGTLIPTLFFGIPGSGTTAVLLAGFVLLGVQTGPNLMQSETGTEFILVVVWTLVLANIIATTVCLGVSGIFVRLSRINPFQLTAGLVVLIVIAAYQATADPLDIVLLIVLGVVAWLMKQTGWPRPPLLIGFVLGYACERYLTVSMTRYGFDWLTRPGVIILGLLLVASIVLATRGRRKIGSYVEQFDTQEERR